MKSNILIIVLGVLLVLPGFAQVCEASQVPKVAVPARMEMKISPSVRVVAQPVPASQGSTLQLESVIGKLGPAIRGILSIDPAKLALISQQFTANNPGDYDGDGIPNKLDKVCQQTPRQLVMLMPAQPSVPGNDNIHTDDFDYTVDANQNLSSDVTVDGFLLRYLGFGGSKATLRSPYNPSQVGLTRDGAQCLWPENGSFRTVSVTRDEWTSIGGACGNMLVRWIYHDEATGNMIFQFMRIVQIPQQCMHPDPSVDAWQGPIDYQHRMQPMLDSPECQNLRFDWKRYSQLAHRDAIPHNYPVGCTIDFPIVDYTGPQHGPCYPTVSCAEASMDCNAVNYDDGPNGKCSNLTECCGPKFVH